MFNTYFLKKDNSLHKFSEFLNNSNGNLSRVITNEMT